MIRVRIAIWLCAAIVVSGATGCAMETTAPTDTENVSEVKQSIVACDPQFYDQCWERTDSTGSISVRVFKCKVAGPPAESNFNTCPGDGDYALVGGGAEIVGEPSPGAMLTSTFPNGPSGPSKISSWVASSKDHKRVSNHQLSVYAIGLKLTGYTSKQLNDVITVTSSSSAVAAHPAASVNVPSGHILLGGGAQTNFFGAQFLTMSRPLTTGGKWYAQSKDHIDSAPQSVTATVISMPACPPGLNYCLSSVVNAASAAAPSGYHLLSNLNTAADLVVSGVGATSGYNGTGRLLADLFPLMEQGGGVSMSSKDHIVQDTGSDDAWYVAIRRQ